MLASSLRFAALSLLPTVFGTSEIFRTANLDLYHTRSGAESVQSRYRERPAVPRWLCQRYSLAQRDIPWSYLRPEQGRFRCHPYTQQADRSRHASEYLHRMVFFVSCLNIIINSSLPSIGTVFSRREHLEWTALRTRFLQSFILNLIVSSFVNQVRSPPEY